MYKIAKDKDNSVSVEVLPYRGYDDSDTVGSYSVPEDTVPRGILAEQRDAVLGKLGWKHVPYDDDDDGVVQIVDSRVNTMTVTFLFTPKDGNAPPFTVNTELVPKNGAKYLAQYPEIIAIITMKNSIVRRGYEAAEFKPFSSSVQIVFLDGEKLKYTTCYESGNVMCVGATSYENALKFSIVSNAIACDAMGVSVDSLNMQHRFDLINFTFELNKKLDSDVFADIVRNEIGAPITNADKNNTPKLFIVYRTECKHDVHKFKGHLKFLCDCRFTTMSVFAATKKICIAGCKSFEQIVHAKTFLNEVIFKPYGSRIVHRKYFRD